MDAVNRFGKNLYNTVLPSLLVKYTNEMYHTFNLQLDDLGKVGAFNLDYRLTANPVIHNNMSDLDFFFDIGPQNNHCAM